MDSYELKLIILCLVFTIAAPLLTLGYMSKFSHPFVVVTLVINVVAFVVVVACFIMKLKKKD